MKHYPNSALYLTTIAVISAVAVVGRNLFLFLPNVQPITIIFLLVTVIFDIHSGMLVTWLTVIISSLYHGFGIWILFQLFVYSILVFFWYWILKDKTPSLHSVQFWIVAGISGYLFGLLYSLCWASVSSTSFIPYYIAGLPFDTYHAVGNVTFYGLLTPTLVPILLSIKNKINHASNH